MSNLMNRFLFGMASGAGNVVIKTVSNMVMVPVIIYELGVEAFGLFVLLVSLPELAMILDMGFTTSMVKMLGEAQEQNDPNKIPPYLTIGHTVYGFLAVLALVLGWFLTPHFPTWFHVSEALTPVAQVAFLLILAECGLKLYTTYYRAVLMAHCCHFIINTSESLFFIAANISAIALLMAGKGLVTILIARLIAAMVQTVILIVYAAKIHPGSVMPKAPFQFKALREIVSLSSHAFVINLSITLSHKIDNFVIALFLPLRMVAYYEIVMRFLGFALQVMIKICEGALPLFSRLLASADTVKVRSLFLRISAFVNLTVCSMLLMIAFFYPHLFKLFTVQKMDIGPTIPVLIALIPSIWSGAIQIPAYYYLFVSGNQRFLSLTSIITALCNVGLSVLLVQHVGIVGAALGTLLPQLIQHHLFLIAQSCRKLHIPVSEYIYKVHIKALFPLAGMGFWLFLMHQMQPLHALSIWMLGGMACSTMLIGFLIWYCKVATLEEKAFFHEKVLSFLFAILAKRVPQWRPD